MCAVTYCNDGYMPLHFSKTVAFAVKGVREGRDEF